MHIFRDYIYMLNCNQHTIAKCTLPLKYINLEVGDIIDFDSLNNNVKAYGEDYTIQNQRNGQYIYPYFIVTSATKSSKDIKIEAMQLHKLTREFTPGLGSLTRKSTFGLNYYTSVFSELGSFTGQRHIDISDLVSYTQMITGKDNYLTTEQKKIADIDYNGSIDQIDLNYILTVLIRKMLVVIQQKIILIKIKQFIGVKQPLHIELVLILKLLIINGMGIWQK